MIALLLAASAAHAQFLDEFSDGDFTTNPRWTGDDAKFVIFNNQLRLQAPAMASSAQLSTPSLSINNAEWQFTLKLNFNPSGSNYTQVYLTSDQANLSGPLNGYFIRIGDTPDEVSLYKQSGSLKTKIVDGADGTVNLSVVNLSVKVTRDNIGNWELLTDIGSTGIFTSEGTVFDNTFKSSAHFGVYCVYTSTRSDEFYFDDFVVTGDPYRDTDPPVIESIEVVSSTQLLLKFNEVLNAASANSNTHYLVTNAIGNPITSALQSDQITVALTFPNEFKNGETNLLSVSGVADQAGNFIQATTLPFLFFQPMPVKPKDIIFTELLADPSPQIHLPDAEYLEIYNRGEVPVDLNGWHLTDGSSLSTFSSQLIQPHTYWVLTAIGNITKFGMLPNLIGMENFPTLNNSGDALVLKTPTNQTIDSINYNLSWYQNSDKQEGGWSLELIDPENTCSEETNWTASENETGGTPGVQNSVWANKPDLTGPKLESVTALSSTQLLLTFDEKLENPIRESANFKITPDTPVLGFGFESNLTLIVTLASPLQAKQLYTLQANSIFDCSGNEIQNDFNHLDFALPEKAEVGDVVINEILFNPRPNGVDFVEIYNTSSKFIDLKNWSISNVEEDSVKNSKSITSQEMILGPQEYLAFTSDPVILKNNYPQGIENNFIQTSLPNFPDDKGSVAISTGENKVLDFFLYQKEFHSEFIKDKEGVSLERVSPSTPTNQPDNWNSASSVAGFATPGFENSNFRKENTPSDEAILIDPELFAPQSGYLDFSKINFHFQQAGFIANVKVLDQQGRLIKTLANNETLPYQGFFRWDGDQEDGNKARAGYYFVWFEIFNSDGLVKIFRKRVIVASR